MEIDGLVAAGAGGGPAPPAPLEAMPELMAAQMTSTSASYCGPAGGGSGGGGTRKMQQSCQSLVLGTVSAVVAR